MLSVTACTWELEDPLRAASDLANQIKKQDICNEGKIGIVLGDSGFNYDVFLPRLQELLQIEIIGCTTIGVIGTQHGYDEFCIHLIVLDLEADYSLQVTGAITKDNIENELKNAYYTCLKNFAQQPNCIITIAPRSKDITFDTYPQILDKISGGVPVYGGIPSANIGESELVLANGKSFADKAIVMLIKSQAKPLFYAASMAPEIAAKKRMITRCKGNIIYKIGDTTAMEYLDELGLDFKVKNPMDSPYAFISNPLHIDPPNGPSYLRAIKSINVNDGSVEAMGKVHDGALVSVGIMGRGEIKYTIEKGLAKIQQLIDKNSSDENKYTTIFCVSCIARNMIMSPEAEMEGGLIMQKLKDKYTLFGFYSWGEICPIGEAEKLVNHGSDSTLCFMVI